MKKKTAPLEAHPFAEGYDMLPAAELAQMAGSVHADGQDEDIILFQGKILDGRNRYKACLTAGVEPRFREFEGDEEAAYRYVVRHNLFRRHLTAEQRAERALEALQRKKASGEAVTQREVAEAASVSRSSIQRAAKKTRAPEATSWTTEDLKKNDELMDLFTSIAHVYGNEDAKAIRTGVVGFKLADVRMLGRMKKEQMLEIKELVMGSHWAPKKCIDFLNKMPDLYTTNEENINYCLATTEKKLVLQFGAFDITIVKKR